MEKKKFANVNTPEEFVDEVNRCGSGRYEIGIDENLEKFESLRATIFFNGARWEYVGEEYRRQLVLYSNANGTNLDRIRIFDIESVELVRCNEYGALYAITTGDMHPQRHLLYLDNPDNQLSE